MSTKEERGMVAVMFGILVILIIGMCSLYSLYVKSVNEAGARFYVEQSNTVTNE